MCIVHSYLNMISSENENIDEIKHRLLCTNLELIRARMEANSEIKKYEETVKRLYKLLRRVCQERDEARDQLQLLIRNFQPSTPAETSSTILQVDHPKHPAVLQHNTKSSVKSTKVSDMSSITFSNRSCDLSLASPQSREKHSSMGLSHIRVAESSNLALPKQPNHQNKPGTFKEDRGLLRDDMIDSASLVIDKLVCGRPLPQKGRLLKTVTETGPLLHTLLVAPLPQWKNPPSLSSSCLPLSSTLDNNSLSTNTDDDKASVNPNRFIPTSLSLAFPGNSCGPQMSSVSGSGLSSVKNEPMSYVDLDSDGMHNHTIAVKKRKFL